jgi:gamma-glutamyltranspeptidase/glutathione hydrolase
MLEILNILEPHDMSQVDPESADAIHLIAEAKKLAFADRDAYLGDAAAAPVAQLLSKSHAERQRRRINSRAASSRFTPGRVRSGQDTTCICAIDEQGSAVVMIQSICHAFGSGVVVPETGVVLNNRMTAFSLDPASPNALEPGKMPLNTLGTYMVFRGDDLWTIGGTPGGDVQIQTNVQVLTQMIDNGRNPQQAIESPKWHVADDGAGLTIEERMPLDTCYELRTLGHQLTIEDAWSAPSASQCIVVDPETGSLLGATDPRVDGLALGY